MLQLIFAAVLVASASACCFPDKMEAECYFTTGQLNETSQEGHYMEGYFTMAFDKTRMMMAEYQHMTYDDTPVDQHLVFDFKQGIMFVYTNVTCTSFKIENPAMPDCLPDENSQPMTYGLSQSPNNVNARGYRVDRNDTQSYWSVTAGDTCMPIAMDSVYNKDGSFQVTMMTFQNVTEGVKDTGVFNVPTMCAMAGPPQPIALAGLGKRSALYQ